MTSRIHKSLVLSVVAALVVASSAFASDTASHSVTVNVNAINEVSIAGGNVTLTIDSATAGSQPDSEESTAATLAFTSNSEDKKITVGTSNETPTYTLKVLAQSVTGGAVGAAEVTLSGSTAQDFITGVGETVGGATLRYTASATAALGVGSDSHTVTYTVVDAS